tara:strand:+ start:1336 stop:2742 length:1407 start_codon:yes stop_codon:yes gene_type:complete
MANDPTYIYSDGSIVTFKRVGPKKSALLKYGETIDESFGIIKGKTIEGAQSFTSDLSILAEEIIIGYNSNRNSLGFQSVFLERIEKLPTPPSNEETNPTPPPPPENITDPPPTTVNTSNEGKFKLDNSSLNNDPTKISPTGNPSNIKIKKEGYKTEIIPIQKGDGTYKENLGVIKLTPTQQQLKLDKLKMSQLSIPEIEFMSLEKKDWKYFLQDQLNSQIINVKKTLIPVVISLIAEFGISKAQEMLGEKLDELKSCPNENKLKEIVKRKNKLVKTLNDILKIIETSLKVAGITQGVITVLDVAVKLLKNTPIPPPIDPSGVISQQKDVNTPKIETILELSKKINGSVLSILVVLRQNLILVLDLLKMLDGLVQDCYPEAKQSDLRAELLELTKEQSNQQSPLIINVNGFEMGVENEKTTSTLKRKRAIARNKQGIVMLKGEYSYSSIDQILIDELSFYIQTNDLKAD